MAFYIVSDPATLRAVESIAIFVFALALLLLIVVLLLRVRLSLRQKRHEKFLRIWRPILVRVTELPTADVPELPRADLVDFLLLWNHLHESVLDESKDHLNQVANALCISDSALRLLRRGDMRERLLATITLGHLRERAAWDDLLRVTRKGSPLLSVVAARALIMIDAAKAAPKLIPLMIKRPDWPTARVASMLETAGADIISDLIAEAAIAVTRAEESTSSGADSKSTSTARRIIQYFPLTHRNSAVPAVRAIVASSTNPEVLASCLRLVTTSLGLDFARRSLVHEDWRVRAQASAALGRIGGAEDEPKLIPLLSDEEWWVRYRAAQALSRLPHMNESRLRGIQAAQTEPFAREMLTQVLAEVQLQ